MKICSSKDLLTIEINKIKKKPQKVGYSIKSIDKLIENAILRYNTIQSTQKDRKFTHSIPYMNGVPPPTPQKKRI